MVLPEGFALPPIPYLFVLSVGTILVLAGLYREDPRIDQYTVLSFLPWMAVGGAFHVLAIESLVGATVAPLLGTPAVYVSTFVLAGGTWLLLGGSGDHHRTTRGTAGVGVGVFGIACVVIVISAAARGGPALLWPFVGLLVSLLLTLVVWGLLTRLLPSIPTETGWVGLAVMFGHILDAVSTTVGVDILGAGERTPIPLYIMDLAGQLPTAEIIGVGWAFVLVKIVIAGGVLWLFTPYVRDDPRQAYVLLGLIAAVGIGPGTHNLLLFALAA